MKLPLNRRQILLRAGAAIVTVAGGRATAGIATDPWYLTDTLGLAARARAKGLTFGTAVGPALDHDPAFVAALLSDATSVVCEYEMKWDALSPKPGVYDFAVADRRVEFARSNGLEMRGHALVWYRSLPPWFAATATRSTAESMLARHIGTVAGRWSGTIASWDVVNEALAAHDGVPGEGDFRGGPLFDLMGPGHVEQAFWMAAAVAPGAELVYNENGIEYATPASARKRAALLRLLEKLRVLKAPVHAVGLQCHGAVDGPEAFDVPALADLARTIGTMGYRVLITELDVHDRDTPGDPASRDARVADTYRRLLDALLAETAVTGVMTWGLSDRYSWLLAERIRSDGSAVRPLPYDTAWRRKAAWGAIAESIDRAPIRQRAPPTFRDQ